MRQFAPFWGVFDRQWRGRVLNPAAERSPEEGEGKEVFHLPYTGRRKKTLTVPVLEGRR